MLMCLYFCLISGQVELQERLDSDHHQLEKLKKQLHSLLETFNTLNENSKVINQLLNELLPWLQDQKIVVEEELEIKELKHAILDKQLSKCQVRVYTCTCTYSTQTCIHVPVPTYSVLPSMIFKVLAFT